MKSYKKDLTDLLITNLGRIDIPEHVEGMSVERVFFFPGASLQQVIPLGVATASGRLTISLNFYEPSRSPESMKALSEKSKQIILNLISK